MKLARCPHCGHDLDLETLVDDVAGRELMGLLSPLDGNLGNAMVKYLALFRPAKRGSTSFDKLLRLTNEVLEQFPDHPRLTVALSTTREGIMSKRTTTEEWKPLKNHNYLKQVYESTPVPMLGAGTELMPTSQARQPETKTGASIAALENLK